MRSRPGRKTHSDRPVENEAQRAVRPSCPAEEAINSDRQTSAQRVKRSTPSARPVSSGRRTNVKLQPPDWAEDEGPGSTPSFRPRAACRELCQIRFSSIPSWATGGERIILRSCPCNRDHAPRVSMVGNLGKSLTVQPLSPLRTPRKRACGAPSEHCRQIVHKSSQPTLRTCHPAIATTVRGSGAAEAQPFAALSACRRALSAAS